MPLAYRTCKEKYELLDATGAATRGGRWNSKGRPVIYGALSYANTLLEILVHRDRPRLPGPHHAVELDIPDGLIETVDHGTVRDWDASVSSGAVAFGDQWLAEQRSAVLLVPAVVARPFEMNVVINPLHREFARIRELRRARVVWDGQLFPTV